jgi:hypothetical protein
MADEVAKIVLTAEDRATAVFRTVQAGLTNVGRTAASIASSFAGVGLAVGGFLTAGTAVAAFTKRVVEGLDALNDLSDATGASIENISALEDVAERTGTSFDSVGTALVKFNQALSNAAAGSQVAAVLERIGLSASELKKQDPAEALRQVAVALAKFSNDGDKARAVQELFGKSLREVAPFLNDLARQGSLVAKVTTEQAEAAERFNHALDNISKNAKDGARSLVSSLLPALEQIAKAFADNGIIAALDKLGNIAFDWEGSQLRKSLKAAEQDIVQTQERINSLSEPLSLGALGKAGSPANALRTNELRDLAQKLEEAKRLRDDIVRRLIDAQSPQGGRTFVDPFAKSIGDTTPNAELLKYIKTLNDAITATRNLSAEEKAQHDILSGSLGKLTKQQEERLLALARSLDKLKGKFALDTPQASFRRSELEAQGDVEKQFATDKLDKFIAAQKELQSILAETQQGQINDLTKQYSALATAFDKGTISAEQYAQGLDVLDEKFGKVTAPVQQAAEKISEFALQAQRNIQDALGDTVLATLEGKFESIGELWANLLKRLVAQAIAARLGEHLLGPDGKSGLIGGFIASAFGGARAGGGDVMAGTSYVVGERGPELFTPTTNGSITPNHALGGAGVTVIQHINVGSGVNRNDVMLAMNAAKNAAVAEVGDAARRARSFA